MCNFGIKGNTGKNHCLQSTAFQIFLIKILMTEISDYPVGRNKISKKLLFFISSFAVFLKLLIWVSTVLKKMKLYKVVNHSNSLFCHVLLACQYSFKSLGYIFTGYITLGFFSYDRHSKFIPYSYKIHSHKLDAVLNLYQRFQRKTQALLPFVHTKIRT